MAKITITFEDDEHGNILVISEPSVETMLKRLSAPHTAAEGLSWVAWKAVIQELNKLQDAGAIKADTGELH